jgi:YfiH family protein
MNWLDTDAALAAAGWPHGWTTVDGPGFRADPRGPELASGMETLREAAGLRAVAWVHQVHGGTVLRADAPGLAGDADALWTDVPGLAVVGRGADCPLVLVGGRRDNGDAVWGFAHASWRSTVAGITASLLKDMSAAGLRAATASALVCPSAGPCCYEVGDEVRAAALAALGDGASAFFERHGARWLLDLWAANAAQLVAAGVPRDAITLTGLCTICGGDRYPSHRRCGDDAGRFAAFIAGARTP